MRTCGWIISLLTVSGPSCANVGHDTLLVRVRVERVEEPAGVYVSPRFGNKPLVVYHLTVLDPLRENEKLVLRSMERNGRWGHEGEVIAIRFHGSWPISGELEPTRILRYDKLNE